MSAHKKKTKKSKKPCSDPLPGVSGGAPKFTDADYNSNDGMITYVWGPPMWHFLHTMSFNYPVKPTTTQKHDYKNYILSLQHVLPCGKCRDNFKANLKKQPLNDKALKNRNSFSRWMYKMHNRVNTLLGKKTSITYEEVRNRYEYFRARCTDSSTEIGCIEMLTTGTKPKCILKIVPASSRTCSLAVDPKCGFK